MAGATTDDAVTCDPWAGGPQICPADSAQFPGQAACSVVGVPCAAGDWASDLPDGGTILYVRAGAPAGGTGTQVAPFGTIAGATSQATSGTVIALNKATFDEPVVLPDGVTLWGACVAQTIVTSSTFSSTAGVITVPGGGTVRNLQIQGNRPGLWASGSAVAVHLDAVVINQTLAIGIIAGNGGQVTGQDVVVRNTQPDSIGHFGRGVDLEFGGLVDLTRAAIVANSETGVRAYGAGGTVRLTDAAVTTTKSRAADGLFGRAVDAENGAQFTLTRVLLEWNRDVAAIANSGSQLTFSDVVVRYTQASAADATSGYGVVLDGTATLDATRTLVETFVAYGVFAQGPGAIARLTDSVVRSSSTTAAPNEGNGIVALDARLEATRVSVEQTANAAVDVEAQDSSATLTDVALRDTAGDVTTQTSGNALLVQKGASVVITRGVATGNHDAAIIVDGSPTTLQAADLAVEGTLSQASDRTGGSALVAQAGATLALQRVALDANRAAALQISDANTNVTAQDLAIRGTLGEEATGTFGRGVQIQGAATFTAARVIVDGNREVGVFATDFGSSVTLNDAVISGTLKRDCVPAGCEDRGGFGAGSESDASIVITRFAITGNAVLGLELVNGGTADLHQGEVSGNPIGANVSTTGFDVTRLQDQVVYQGNGQNLTSQDLPLPDPGLPPFPTH